MTTDTKIRKRTCLKCKQEKEEWNYKYTQSPYFPGHRSMICTACSRVYGSVKGKSLREERSQIIKAVSLDNRREQKKEKSKENGVVMRFS